MAENTAIEWCDHTFNPWVGCTKVSPGCDHCYAEAWAKRSGSVKWGGDRRLTTPANWRKPLQWQAKAAEFQALHGRRQRVFCASLADVFDNAAAPQWRVDLFRLIAMTPSLDWLLLTKRIGNASEMIKQAVDGASCARLPTKTPQWPWPNVWIGATVCNQEEADRDIPKLLQVQARVRFLSIEPMLGPISFNGMFANPERINEGTNALEELDWVICGGESGPSARPMHPDWARDLRDQCEVTEVPFLFKQWGEWCPRGPESLGYPSVDGVPRLRMTDAGQNGQDLGARGGNDVWMNRAGKKTAGRLLDGIEHNGFPVTAKEQGNGN